MQSMFIRSPEGISLEFIFKLAGRLLLILLVVETLIMFVLRFSGISQLGAPTSAVADGVLLVVCCAPLVYYWVLLPALQEFRKAEERMRLLASAMQDAGEVLIAGRHSHGGVGGNNNRSLAGRP